MTEPVKEQTKSQKIVGGIFGLIGLAAAIYLIVMGIKLIFI